MTTQELLEKAHGIVTQFMAPESIEITFGYDYEKKEDKVSISVFTKNDKNRRDYSNVIYISNHSHPKNINLLLFRLKQELELRKMEKEGINSEEHIEVIEHANQPQA